jgi:predicted ATPase
VESETTPRFFVSYRREDAPGHVGRLADHLLARFGSGSVFMDVESIEAGADFTAQIGSAIGRSDAVLIVIGPGWLEAKSANGSRRLDDPADFVVAEIRAALDADVRLIPVLVGGASMPAEQGLPESIAWLARRNAVELLDRRWREDVDTLVEILEGRDRGRLGNLPIQTTPFLGRGRELADVLGLLRREDVRVLTLTGPGGIGKTRLAVQAAFKLAYTYLGGAWFVGLAGLADPAFILPEIAHALGVRDGGERSLLHSIAERFSRDRTLLVVDNLEQLLPDAASPIVELSTAVPSLDLVVSSREPLHVTAEREYPLDALSEDEAVAFFSDRARASRPDFTLGEADAKTVMAICDRLDRLPLAIELAAARTKLLSLEQLLERLDQRLPLLSGGARDVPARQRTLRATIAWSYDLLSEDERDQFERLSVFSGGCNLEAAETVCEADLDTMQSLIERSLLRKQSDAGVEPRVAMLETIREFASEHFGLRPDADALRGGHAEHFLRMVENDADRKTDEAGWVQRLEADHDNLRAALGWSLDGGDPSLGLRLIVELFDSWYQRRPVSEIRRWLLEALERTPATPTELRARGLIFAGVLAADQGEDGTALLEESIRCAREAGATSIEASAVSHLSALLPADRAGEKVPLSEEAVRLARVTGDRRRLASTLNNLGEAYRSDGDIGAAMRVYQESCDIMFELDDALRIPILLVNLAETAISAGDLPRARGLAAEALERAESSGRPGQALWAHAALGWVALGEGGFDEATRRFGESLALARDLGYASFSSSLLHGAAGAAAALGDVVRAARLEAAASRLEEDAPGHQPTAADAGIHRRYLEELRSASGESPWIRAARDGAGMTVEEAIEFALT